MELSIVGIGIAFAGLIIAAYKKINMVLAAILAAAVIAASSGLSVIDTMIGSEGAFLNGMKDFVGNWMAIFAISALLGALYDNSGATWRISNVLINKAGTKWTLVIYVLIGGLLVYGGIQVTVMIFVLLPFAKIMFPKAGIPWYLFPGITSLAIATYAMGQMPGSLQMQNIIPTKLLGTSLTAAPVEGILATIFMLVFGIGYLEWQVRKGRHSPEADITRYKVQGGILDEYELEKRAPKFAVSLFPLIVTFALINGFHMEMAYGLATGCILSLVLFYRSFDKKKVIHEMMSEGFNNGILSCIIIASVVGVGKVISVTDTFTVLQAEIIHLPLPGLFKVASITTIIAGITGSASGGLTIALELFGSTFVSWGYSPDIIHRVASIACGGLDTLPWNGTVVMLFALSGVSYRKGYLHVAVESVILPLLSLIPVAVYYAIMH